MRFRTLTLFAALALTGTLGIAWGGPTLRVAVGVVRSDSDGAAIGHNYMVLAAGMHPDGDGTAGGQAHAVRSDGDGTVAGQP